MKPRKHRKIRSLQRMRQAIDRAIGAASLPEKERAARWAAAWGAVAGIPVAAGVPHLKERSFRNESIPAYAVPDSGRESEFRERSQRAD